MSVTVKRKSGKNLILKNGHGVVFIIEPNTVFQSIWEKTVQGTFVHFGDNTATIKIALKDNKRKNLVVQFDNEEFWDNLEILMRNSSSSADVETIDLNEKNISLEYSYGLPQPFNVGDKFATTVFRPDNWTGYLSSGHHFDFSLTSGKPITILGSFKSFDSVQQVAKISIDFTTKQIVAGVVAALILAWLGYKGYEKWTAPPAPAAAAAAAAAADSSKADAELEHYKPKKGPDFLENSYFLDNISDRYIIVNPARAEKMLKGIKYELVGTAPRTKRHIYRITNSNNDVLAKNMYVSFENNNNPYTVESKKERNSSNGFFPWQFEIPKNDDILAAITEGLDKPKTKQEGGGWLTYEVSVKNTSLPFWKNLILKSWYCKIRDAKQPCDPSKRLPYHNRTLSKSRRKEQSRTATTRRTQSRSTTTTTTRRRSKSEDSL
jgi:hypothetical protein